MRLELLLECTLDPLLLKYKKTLFLRLFQRRTHSRNYFIFRTVNALSLLRRINGCKEFKFSDFHFSIVLIAVREIYCYVLLSYKIKTFVKNPLTIKRVSKR